MGERERHEHGSFSWTDLATPVPDAARDFYGGLLGWEFEDNPIPDGGGVYRMARLDGRAAAAMYSSTEQHPAWLSYVTVDDLEGATGRARELGANVMSEPFDVMDVGRMSLFQDPTGAVLALWEPRSSIGAEVVNGPGAITLNQLNTTDPAAAERFYTDLFGWRFDSVGTDEQPYWGIYRADGTLNGGMMPMPEGGPAPSHWLVYFGIADVDAAAERIGATGGTLMLPPRDVPGGRILVAHDGQGAVFGLFAGRFDD